MDLLKEKTKIVICGKGGSGKDYLRNELKSLGFKPSISVTSRKKRDKELDGVDYIFKTKEEFESLIKEDKFQEWAKFGGNYYGCLKKTWDECNVFIKEPKGIKQLNKEERSQCKIIYLDIDQSTRIIRFFSRMNINNNTNEEIKSKIDKRIEDDDIAFKCIVDYDIRIRNPNFTVKEVLYLLFLKFSDEFGITKFDDIPFVKSFTTKK